MGVKGMRLGRRTISVGMSWKVTSQLRHGH